MITYAMKSEKGCREYNEDYIRVNEKNNSYVFALADGLGGCGYGELASKTAVESVMAYFQRKDEKDHFFEHAFEEAQSAVIEKQLAFYEARSMSTTMVVLKIEDGYAGWAHIGDSRMYHFREGRVYSQTLDHSVPQMLQKIGKIRQSQIRHHKDRNRLLNIIGRPWDGVQYEIAEEVPVQRGDAFLLCTDGFWEYITENKMCKLWKRSKNVSEWLEKMIKTVEKNGSGSDMDNYSAICVQIE